MTTQQPFDKGTAFDRAADLILDIIEEAFEIRAPHGRGRTKETLIRIFEYYCIPKDGPDGNSSAERAWLKRRELYTLLPWRGLRDE